MTDGLPFNGTSLNYRIDGAVVGRWLVCTHGMGLHSGEFDQLVGALPHWRILRWDMPGHGASGPLANCADVERMADALAALLDHLKIERALFLGFSFGGMVTQALVRREPGLVGGLILHGSFAPYLQKPPVPHWAAPAVAWWLFGRPQWSTVRASFARACARSSDMWPRLERMSERLGQKAFVRMTTALFRGFRTLPFSIKAPLLLVRGEHDVNGAQLIEAQHRLAAAASQATLVIIAGAGHCAHLDDPPAFNAAVEAFLANMEPES